MNNISNNNLNFKSNIHFVSSPNFRKQAFKNYFYCTSNSPLIDSMQKGGKIWTQSVRTCSAGGLVDSKGALGFHFFNCLETIKKVKEDLIPIIQKENSKTQSALLIGAKRICDSSPMLFDTVLEKLKEVVNPSYFKIFKNIYSECGVGYDKPSDSWFINLTVPKDDSRHYIPKDILTLEELQNDFEEIKIAPQDKLFINGKEIKKSDAPEIFE